MAKHHRDHEDRLILRVDNSDEDVLPLVQGYSMRIYRDVNFSRFFADSVYGGKEQALQAARKARDELEEKMAPLPKPRLTTTLWDQNPSEIRGVRPRTLKRTREGKTTVYTFIEASWNTSDGRVLKRKFSVDDLGLMEAWQQAIECWIAETGHGQPGDVT